MKKIYKDAINEMKAELISKGPAYYYWASQQTLAVILYVL